MNFGLTGIGIGGLFYIGCAIVILMKEGCKKMRSRYHVHPRQLIIDLALILAGIIIATLLTDWGLQSGIMFFTVHMQKMLGVSQFTPSTGLTEVRSIFIGITALLIVLSVTQVLRFIVRPTKKNAPGKTSPCRRLGDRDYVHFIDR